MNETEYNELIETSWRRELRPEEAARLNEFLSRNPEAKAQWAEDAALNRVLARVPNAPVSSNFTALVMQAVEAEERSESRQRWRDLWRTLFGPVALRRAAVAVTLMTVGLVTYHQYAVYSRAQFANSLSTFSSVTAVPSVEIWRNFDTINRLSELSNDADIALLAAMK